MDLLEYQGKELFRAAGIPVLPSALAKTPEEAAGVAAELGYPLAIKAQVLTGGRGKAGGVKVAQDSEQLQSYAPAILALTIKGKPVQALLVEAAAEVLHEFYIAITLDRRAKYPLLIFSRSGGIDIEQLAAEDPDALLRMPVDPLAGVGPAQMRRVLEMAKLDDKGLEAQLADLLARLWALYRERDATLVEVNPLALVSDGDGRRLVALDAKISVDETGLYRQPILAAMRAAGENEQELAARQAGVSYIGLEGDIGVAGNGAGLLMSTLDLIGAAGGAAADFCDVGGGARAERIAAALNIVSHDERLHAVLLNIFGGITRCDEAASGVLAWMEKSNIDLPLVVRLDGSNVDEGLRILGGATASNVQVTSDPLEAVRLVVAAAAANSGSSITPAEA